LIGLGVRDKLRKRIGGKVFASNQNARHVHNQPNRRKVSDSIEVRPSVESLVVGEADAAEE